jgi:hypothetical protein
VASNTEFDFARWIVTILPTFISGGAVGALVTAWLTSRRERTTRRAQFIKQQVEEFYSPLVGIRRAIRAKSELRVKIHGIAGSAWVDVYEGVEDPRSRQEITQQNEQAFDKLQDYSEKQLVEDLLPLYRRMLTLFADRWWLAEDSTKAQYPKLVEYVEIWNRFDSKTLPRQVAQRLGHSEQSLNPLYDDIETQLERLRAQLSTGKV